MEHNPYQSLGDLPATLPVFPLTGALLFPRWPLPLNIFEPRYLNMFDDALAGDRLIGMIQTTGGGRANPTLASVGCVGKITAHSETGDGRYMVSLKGVIRFAINAELDVRKPYRQVSPDFTPFADDLSLPAPLETPTRAMIMAALKPYAAAKGLETDWDAIAEADIEILISALSAGCPFEMMEKQALLEAEDLQTRADILIQLMLLHTPHTQDDGDASLQ